MAQDCFSVVIERPSWDREVHRSLLVGGLGQVLDAQVKVLGADGKIVVFLDGR